MFRSRLCLGRSSGRLRERRGRALGWTGRRLGVPRSSSRSVRAPRLRVPGRPHGERLWAGGSSSEFCPWQ